MKLFQVDDHPPVDGDHRTFTGNTTRAAIDGLGDNPPVNMYRVWFEPRARTAWHSHTGPQLLLVIEGTCRIQKDGEPVQEVASGGAIRIEPGERHWHGATPDGPMTHLALNIDAKTNWSDQVTDDQYDAGV